MEFSWEGMQIVEWSIAAEKPVEVVLEEGGKKSWREEIGRTGELFGLRR
jgi:hypothetical protein